MSDPFSNDYYVQRKRNKDNQLQSLYGYIKTNSCDYRKAKWEDDSNKALEVKQYKMKQKQFEDQQKKFTDMRRKNLSQLMHSEGNQYINELVQSQESSGQVRLRMEETLKQLKKQREKDRLANVNHLQERRFYDSADELRKNESDTFAIACYYEQENQMLDKLRTRNRDRKEEEAYVKLNEFDTRMKIEREHNQEREKKEKLKRTYDYLKWQREEQKESLRRSAQLDLIEKNRLREQWQRDNQNEEEEKRKRLLENVEVNRDIEKYNIKENYEKQKKSEYEKAKEKELIESVVQKEKALDLIDRQEKEKKMKEFIQNKRYMQHIMQQKKEQETWMDILAQEETKRQFKKKDEQWLREEGKRIELLKNVYKDRDNSVYYKKNRCEEEKKALEKGRQILDEEIKQYNQQIEEIKRNNALIEKAHQNELMYQISAKENQRRRELQDKLYEERAAHLWEMEYQKKIIEQKELHKQKLAEITNKVI